MATQPSSSEPMTEAGELFEEVGADPTMDAVMRKDPKAVTDGELLGIVEQKRRERVLFNIREQQKKDRAEGILDTVTVDDETAAED
jgi:hypothetical protein